MLELYFYASTIVIVIINLVVKGDHKTSKSRS